LTWAGSWACSSGRTRAQEEPQEGQKMPGPGLWVQENLWLGLDSSRSLIGITLVSEKFIIFFELYLK